MLFELISGSIIQSSYSKDTYDYIGKVFDCQALYLTESVRLKKAIEKHHVSIYRKRTILTAQHKMRYELTLQQQYSVAEKMQQDPLKAPVYVVRLSL